MENQYFKTGIGKPWNTFDFHRIKEAHCDA